MRPKLPYGGGNRRPPLDVRPKPMDWTIAQHRAVRSDGVESVRRWWPRWNVRLVLAAVVHLPDYSGASERGARVLPELWLRRDWPTLREAAAVKNMLTRASPDGRRSGGTSRMVSLTMLRAHLPLLRTRRAARLVAASPTGRLSLASLARRWFCSPSGRLGHMACRRVLPGRSPSASPRPHPSWPAD
jgi:hypothetical protein